MTRGLTIRPLFGVVFSALIALSLITTTIDAFASTPTQLGGTSFLDQGFTNAAPHRPRPIGRLGVTWE